MSNVSPAMHALWARQARDMAFHEACHAAREAELKQLWLEAQEAEGLEIEAQIYRAGTARRRLRG